MSDQNPSPPKWRRWLLLALRIGGTAAGFGYIAFTVKPRELGDAFSRASIVAFVIAMAITGVNLLVGALRWRVLLAAYGAPNRPSIWRLYHAYMVGFFYNNYLPGGVGGDVVRAVITRQSFGDKGATAAIAVVFVERALGLTGLLVIVCGTYLVHPIAGTEGLLWWSALFLAAPVIFIGAIAFGRRFAKVLPGRLGKIAADLPVIEKIAPFVLALLLSLVTQSLVSVTGWVVMSPINPAITLPNAMVLVPLAMAASYFPFTVGGAGVREMAFVTLARGALHLPESEAAACSLLLGAVSLVVGGIGGLIQFFFPFKASSE